jgi:hypothetical protein
MITQTLAWRATGQATKIAVDHFVDHVITLDHFRATRSDRGRTAG